MATTWHTPSCVELSADVASAVRRDLMRQAFRARECYSCLAPLRDRNSVYCSQACADEMADHPHSDGMVDRASALIINLPFLSAFAQQPELRRYAA